jgi:hypothetical protein
VKKKSEQICSEFDDVGGTGWKVCISIPYGIPAFVACINLSINQYINQKKKKAALGSERTKSEQICSEFSERVYYTYSMLQVALLDIPLIAR